MTRRWAQPLRKLAELPPAANTEWDRLSAGQQKDVLMMADRVRKDGGLRRMLNGTTELYVYASNAAIHWGRDINGVNDARGVIA